MANRWLIELEHLINENQKLSQQNENLSAIVLKFKNRQKTLNILLGSQQYINNESCIKFYDYMIHALKNNIRLKVSLYHTQNSTSYQILYVLLQKIKSFAYCMPY